MDLLGQCGKLLWIYYIAEVEKWESSKSYMASSYEVKKKKSQKLRFYIIYRLL